MTQRDEHPPYLTSDVLGGTPHGFFSRVGGVSKDLYESLNCGPGSGDDPDSISENRRRCLAALAPNKDSVLFTAYQVHSADAVFVTAPDQDQPKADALVTDQPGLALGILTADCIPVLFHAPGAGLIGAAHAGWRGALGGILESCVSLMTQHGASPSSIKACIGPCLRPPHFQVGRDVFDAFTGKHPVSTRYFTPETENDGKYQLDLAAFAAWRLEEMGLHHSKVADTGANTLARPDTYFSYRHARQSGHADYGRNLSAIML